MYELSISDVRAFNFRRSFLDSLAEQLPNFRPKTQKKVKKCKTFAVNSEILTNIC